MPMAPDALTKTVDSPLSYFASAMAGIKIPPRAATAAAPEPEMAAKKQGGDHDHRDQTALPVTHAGIRKADQLLRDTGVLHNGTGQNKEQDRQKCVLANRGIDRVREHSPDQNRWPGAPQQRTGPEKRR